MNEILRNGFRIGDTLVCPNSDEVIGPGGVSCVHPVAMEILLLLASQAGKPVKAETIAEQVWPDGGFSEDSLDEHIGELRVILGDSHGGQKIIKFSSILGYQLELLVQVLVDPVCIETAEKSSANGPPSIVRIIADLRKRRVFRSLGGYAIFMWVAVQVADAVFEPLGVPYWAMSLLVWISVLGFPVVAILSWTLQVTDTGIVFDDTSADSQRPVPVMPGRAIDFAIIGVLVIIIGFLVYERVTNEIRPPFIMTEEGEFKLPELTPASIEKNSIAVLPFNNLSEDPLIEYLADGLAEDVLNLLANIRELKVPSRSSSFYFKNKDIDLESVAQRLRVKNVLEGSVSGPIEDMLISTQLVDANSGYNVWSQIYSPRNADVLQVRDEIARSVVESLKVVLSVESQNYILRRPTQSADAYDYYLQALSYLRRPRSDQTLDNAEGLFRRALDHDPEYALAYAGLCETYLGKFRLNHRTEVVEPAERSCNQALILNPGLVEVHVALGNLYRHRGKNEEAEREYHRAIVMNPKLETAYYGLAMVYEAQNRLKEAEDLLKYAVDLEPGYWGTHLALGNYYLDFGQPARAIQPFTRVTELNPEYALGFNSLGAALYNSGALAAGEAAYLKSLDIAPSEFALSNMGSVYYHTGRFEAAVEMFERAIDYTPNDFRNWGRLAFAQRFVPGLEDEAGKNFRSAISLVLKALEINPNDWRILAYLSSYYANVDDPESSKAVLEQALSLGPDDPHVHYFGAVAKMASGENEAALSFLERASRLGYASNAIASDPDFIDLRDEERFKALLDAG